MLNQWLCVLFQASPGLAQGFAMDSMQTAKKNAPPKWIRVGAWLVVSVVGTLYNVFGKKHPAELNYVSCLMSLLVILVSFYFFYESSFRRQIIISLILILAVFSAELFTGMLMWIFDIRTLSMDHTQFDMVLLSFTGAIASNTVIFLMAMLWRRFKLQKPTGRSSWAFVIMLLCLLVPQLVYSEQIQQTGGTFSSLHILSMTGGFILNISLICVQFNQAEKEEAEKELSALKRQTELEHQYYESVEARREEMAKIRHDYNNHLSSVLGLINMGKSDEAEQVIESLLAKVNETENDRENCSFSMEENEC